MRLMRLVLKWAMLTSISFIVLEVLLHIFIQMPLYESDQELGYYIRPNQRGDLPLAGSWSYNDFGMQTGRRFRTSPSSDVLLIGDSVVMGSSTMPQTQHLGAIFGSMHDVTVWPVGAGSWGFRNELLWLSRHRQVADQVDQIVIVVNRGDFGYSSKWTSEQTHPTRQPLSFFLWLLMKYNPFLSPPKSTELMLNEGYFRQGLDRDIESFRRKTIIIGFQAKDDKVSNCAWKPNWIHHYGNFHCFNSKREFGATGFSDSIHPTYEGNRIFAQYLYSTIPAPPAELRP